MTFAKAVAAGFRNYANFKGRASRSEFWFWVLFTVIVSLVLSTIESAIWPAPTASPDWMQNLELTLSQPTPLTSIASLTLLIPNLSVAARRFHDAGFSAKWLFIQVVPVVYGLFATVGVVSVFSNAPSGQMLTTEELMSLIFLIVPIFGLFIVAFVIFLILALRPTKSFYDGNRYVEPEPLDSMDEGTTA
jgi:uncharacterized membrane protein YhaH (DUF805 family)